MPNGETRWYLKPGGAVPTIPFATGWSTTTGMIRTPMVRTTQQTVLGGSDANTFSWNAPSTPYYVGALQLISEPCPKPIKLLPVTSTSIYFNAMIVFNTISANAPATGTAGVAYIYKPNGTKIDINGGGADVVLYLNSTSLTTSPSVRYLQYPLGTSLPVMQAGDRFVYEVGFYAQATGSQSAYASVYQASSTNTDYSVNGQAYSTSYNTWVSFPQDLGLGAPFPSGMRPRQFAPGVPR